MKYLKPFNCVQKNDLKPIKNDINKMCLQTIYIYVCVCVCACVCVCVCKDGLALNNLQCLICH